MANNAFTQGIKPGGLTTDYEIRMLVCWILFKINTPINLRQLNHALQLDGLVNYFELANAVVTLLKSQHIVESEMQPGEESPFYLTELGAKTATTFEKNIPLSVREKSLSAVKESLLLETLESENSVTIVKVGDGYKLNLIISDVGNNLLELSMYVPTLTMCEKMKKTFLRDPTAIYIEALKTLSGEELGGTALRD